jgi:hypothetical protein
MEKEKNESGARDCCTYRPVAHVIVSHPSDELITEMRHRSAAPRDLTSITIQLRGLGDRKKIGEAAWLV